MRIDRNHIIHYLIIIGIILMGISLVIIFSADRFLQLITVIFFSALYLCYGILHHFLEHDLTIKIVIEYVLISLLAMSVLVFVRGGI